MLKIRRAKSSHLHVEELSSVKHSLFLFSCHLIEQIGVIWVLNQINSAIFVFIIGHVGEHVLFALL